MQAELRGVIACPACGGRLVEAPADPICASCGRVVPGADWIHDLRAGVGALPGRARAEELEPLHAARCGRGLRDSYAAFRPFNESSRLLDLLLPTLKRDLAPGSLLLDCWGRTPWTASWLAGHLPEVTVVSVWEGERGIMGLDGYRYWFGSAGRPPNLQLVFADLTRAWPFADASFDAVHGLDTLHRYGVDHVFAEARRVAKANAPIIFSHQHLADHDPDPYFDRGCEIRPREGYERIFAADPSGRQWTMVPEAGALRRLKFGGEVFETRFETDKDYNSFIFGLPEGTEPAPFDPPQVRGEDRGVVSPLVELSRREPTLRADEDTRWLLDRHPPYEWALTEVIGSALEPAERAALALFASGWTVEQVGAGVGVGGTQLDALVEGLAAKELLRVGPISTRVVDAQAYFDARRSRRRARDFAELWSWVPELFGERAVLEFADGSEFPVEALQMLVGASVRWLLENSEAGQRVALVSGPRPELYIMVWAALLSGRVVVPIDASLTPEGVEQRLGGAAPALVVRERGAADLRWDESTDGVMDFESMLANYLEGPELQLPVLDPTADAVVLFTSGTTGAPKGVRLSQRSLLHSSYALTERFGWNVQDRLLCPEAPHAMSGFRNPVIAALVAGVSVYIPEGGAAATLAPRRRLALGEGRCTLATTVPAEAEAWMDFDAPPATSLRQIALTGYACSEELRQRVAAHFRCEVPTYYGLTETGGHCMAYDGHRGQLGRADGAALRIVDEVGEEIWDDRVGELLVASAGLMNGYLDPESVGVRIVDGWLYTGDAVRWCADGSVEHLGRRDRLIKLRNGDRLSLDEIERVVTTLEGVESVRARRLEEGVGYSLSLCTRSEPDGIENRVLAHLKSALGAGSRPARINIEIQAS